MNYYANVFDVVEIDAVGRGLIADWFDTDDVATLDPNVVDGDYIRIEGEDGELTARAEILSERFDVRVKSRSGGEDDV